MIRTDSLDDEARYRALCAHDARFDGRFFAAVTSTGIYCRPVCRVRTPRRENCLFFEHAAQAESAGFRPCLRCRPELAPPERHWSAEDAAGILVHQALRLLDAPATWLHPADDGSPLARLATRLGVSERHLRRLFEQRLGVSPLQYLLTRRLLAAKQLLADTALPVAQVALASGFSSLRRFNAAFQARYGLNPSALRRGQAALASSSDIRLTWRPPFDAGALLGFLARRQLPGVEAISIADSTLSRTLRLTVAGASHQGSLRIRIDPAANALRLQVSDGLVRVLPVVIGRVREVFDLDANPEAINAALQGDFPGGAGERVPGCFDGFELAVRAILGQQVSVDAARTLTGRLIDRFGDPFPSHEPALNRLFPSPERLAAAEANQLGEAGIVRQRQRALQALAQAVASGALVLDASAPLGPTLEALQNLPGVGPWTSHYIAMRALRWPDAWPAGDVALHHALGLAPPRDAAARRDAERLSARWQPWRSYAAIRAWAGHHRPAP